MLQLVLRILILSVILVWLNSSPVLAHSFSGSTDAESNPPEEGDEPEPENCDGDSGSAGKPVDLFSGAERFKVTDMRVPGPLPITLVRHYDSQSRYDSTLGYGWALNHDKRLYEYADGSVIIRYNCGIKQKFVKGQDSSNVYETVGGARLRGTLVQESDGHFSFTNLKGWLYRFDTLGRLIMRQRPDGLSLQYTYSEGKYPVVGLSPYSITPDKPITTSRHYRLLAVRLHLADNSMPGQALLFTYDDNTGRLKTVSDNAGRTVHYHHDVIAENSTQGNLIAVTGLAGRVSTYEYNDANDTHNVTFIQHRQSEASAVNTYDDQDRVIGQIWGETEYVFSYDDSNLTRTVSRLLKVGDETETLTDSYTFNSDARVTKRVYADGTESNYSFNAQRRVTGKTTLPRPAFSFDAEESSEETVESDAEAEPDASYDYDALGRKIYTKRFITDTDFITETRAYDNPLGLMTELWRTSSVAPDTVYYEKITYDESYPGRVIQRDRQVDEGTVRSTLYSYHGNGLLATITLPNQDQLRFTYTDKGQLATRQLYRDDTAVPETLYSQSYDAFGFVASRSDLASGTTHFENDPLGRKLKITNALNESTLYSYANDLLSFSESGQTVTGDTIQHGRQVQYAYDDYARLSSISVLNNAGELQLQREQTYDSLHRLVSIKDGAGRVTQYGYDARDRRISAQIGNNQPSTTSYDSMNRVATTTDPLQRSTHYVYDLLGRLRSVKDPENGITEYRHNVLNQVVSITDPENSTTFFSYNGMGERLSEERPTKEVMTYQYDSLGRLLEQSYPGQQVFRFSYTPFGALSTRQLYSNADVSTATRIETYSYNDRGLLASVSDTGTGGEQYRFTYDTLGRELTTTYSYLPFDYRVSKAYNALGQVEAITRVQGEQSDILSYTYDKRALLVSANLYQQAITVEYNDAFQLSAINFPAVREQRIYSETTGMMTGQVFSTDTTTLDSYTLDYDDVFNLTSLTSQRQGTRNYTYNNTDRLTQVNAENAQVSDEAYAYDGVGNRLGEGYNYDESHRLLGVPDLNFTYDIDGNMLTGRDGLIMAYDKRNRLSSAIKEGVTTHYQYDVFNRRLSKTTNSDAQYFIWEGMQLTGEYTSAGTKVRAYAYLPDQLNPSVVKSGGSSYLIHNNYLDTPVLLTNDTGAIVWEMQSTAYGEAIINNDVDGDGINLALPLRFPGQYEDSETGLYYNLNRHYDPVLGRYIQSDPIGLNGGLNTYNYVSANPVNSIDPLGLAEYRNGRGDYSDRPGGENCERAVWMGGYIIAWEPCHDDDDYEEPSDCDSEDNDGEGDDGDGNTPSTPAPNTPQFDLNEYLDDFSRRLTELEERTEVATELCLFQAITGEMQTQALGEAGKRVNQDISNGSMSRGASRTRVISRVLARGAGKLLPGVGWLSTAGTIDGYYSCVDQARRDIVNDIFGP